MITWRWSIAKVKSSQVPTVEENIFQQLTDIKNRSPVVQNQRKRTSAFTNFWIYRKTETCSRLSWGNKKTQHGHELPGGTHGILIFCPFNWYWRSNILVINALPKTITRSLGSRVGKSDVEATCSFKNLAWRLWWRWGLRRWFPMYSDEKIPDDFTFFKRSRIKALSNLCWTKLHFSNC